MINFGNKISGLDTNLALRSRLQFAGLENHTGYIYTNAHIVTTATDADRLTRNKQINVT